MAAGIIRASVPFQGVLRQLKRKIRPYRANADNSDLAFDQGLQQIELLREAGATLSGDVLELGSGWLPIVPMLFHIAGAQRSVLTDVVRLMDDHTIAEATRMIAARMETVANRLQIPIDAARARLAQPFRPRYLVPWQPSDLPTASIDIIVSRTTLEHIPVALLDSYFAEFCRILRPEGLMCHAIDNSDHWQHHDRSLSRVNFLRYEDDWLWRLMCRRRYQNRLRHSDYVAMFQRHGWQPVSIEAWIDQQSLSDLQSLPLASPFSDRDHDDLATLGSTFVLRRLGAQPPTVPAASQAIQSD